MRAVVLESYGEPEVLRVADVPEPTPGPDEVIVEVAASALNRADLLQRRGGYPGPKLVYGGRTFDIPGMELAGNVVELGARVTEFEPHQAVMAIVSGGGYAERCAVHERQLLPVPSAVSRRDAAAIPEVFITAWDALGRARRTHVRPHRARARRCLGRRHGRDSDRQGNRRPHHRHDVRRQGRGMSSARGRPRRRLHERGLRRRRARVHERAGRRRDSRRHRRRLPRAQPRRARHPGHDRASRCDGRRHGHVHARQDALQARDG